MNDAAATLVVCDAGPLIHLDQLDCLDLLTDFSRVVIPDAVWLEVERHRPSALKREAVEFVRLKPKGEPSPELISMSSLLALHAGEVQALQIAQDMEADLLLTDDAAARLAARNLRVAVHGTLGILLRAIRRGQRTPEEIPNILRALPVRSTLHIKRNVLDQVIRQVEEST